MPGVTKIMMREEKEKDYEKENIGNDDRGSDDGRMCDERSGG